MSGYVDSELVFECVRISKRNRVSVIENWRRSG